MDLYDIIWNALSPYMFSIAKLAVTATLFSIGLKMIRAKIGHVSAGGSNPYQSLLTAFFGYLLIKGIPIILALTDTITTEMLSQLTK